MTHKIKDPIERVITQRTPGTEKTQDLNFQSNRFKIRAMIEKKRRRKKK